MPLRSGDLRERITLQTRVRTPDVLGGYVSTWSTVGTFWARVVAGSGTKAQEGDQEISPVRYRVYIRYRTLTSPPAEMQILWRGRTFQVEAILPGEQRDMTILDCTDAPPLKT
jgi:SPP1 family predicted phage head-tail adaptor